MNYRVIPISELSHPQAFEMREFLLGDPKGTWVVVGPGGFPFGRWDDLEKADEHAADLNRFDEEGLNREADKQLLDDALRIGGSES